MLHQIDHGRRASPLVMRGMVDGWPARAWTPESLALGPLGGTQDLGRDLLEQRAPLLPERSGARAVRARVCTMTGPRGPIGLG